uniref:Isocitrate dehydrogenase [NAD] subunit gamma, mitochondrial-like n=1 Tax=Cavia porcellus TaxID=10141 RepID=H0WCL1_CAVPO
MTLKLMSTSSCSMKTTFHPGILGHSWEVFLSTAISLRNPIPPPAKYVGRHTVTMIPGDDIGPELMMHVKSVFRCARVPVDFEEVRVTTTSGEEEIHNAIMAVHRNSVALKGSIKTDHTKPPSHKSYNNLLITTLDLYANVTHFKNLPNVDTHHQGIDILVIRDNTEGEYSDLEHESVKGVIESLKIITKAKSLRIAEYAFQLAQNMGRRKVTAVHKANIMKLGDGLFLECCREVASHYPQVALETMVVDNATMQLVTWPQQFDVMLMPNLYGNVVTNICTGLVGDSANYGCLCAVFETAARQLNKNPADWNWVNPTALLLASCIMLDYLRLHSHAATIRAAVLASLGNKNIQTPDIGGQGSMMEIMRHIIDHIRYAN